MDVDTIAAISTGPGAGAIAMVRVSGPEAGEVLLRLAPALEAIPAPRMARVVDICEPDDGEVIDRAVATYYRKPESYTGEDVVELTCHGGVMAPRLVLGACLAAGARQAEAGEFTKRAYLRGKLDLIQAEAVSDLIEARSRAFHRAALRHMERGLSTRITGLRESLVHLESLLVHHIDFPEEDEPPVAVDVIAEEAKGVVRELDALLVTAPEGELLREGALTVFAGRPNAGKSSVFNALLGEERAIVTEEPGTTRDALEETVQLGGFPFRLVDTAGLRESEGRVEQLGIEVALRYLKGADIVLFCIPASEETSEEDRGFLEKITAPVVLLETKADLAGGPERDTTDLRGLAGAVRVSALSGQGLDQIRQLLPELAYSGLVGDHRDQPILTRQRHIRALKIARSEVEFFRSSLEDGLPAEIASTHLRPAETALEEVLGVITVDDVLDVVFREFCVGK